MRIVCGVDEHVVSLGAMKTMAFVDADLRGFEEEEGSSVVIGSCSSFVLVDALVERVVRLGGMLHDSF